MDGQGGCDTGTLRAPRPSNLPMTTVSRFASLDLPREALAAITTARVRFRRFHRVDARPPLERVRSEPSQSLASTGSAVVEPLAGPTARLAGVMGLVGWLSGVVAALLL